MLRSLWKKKMQLNYIVKKLSNLRLARYISHGQWAVSKVEELNYFHVRPIERGTVPSAAPTIEPPVDN